MQPNAATIVVAYHFYPSPEVGAKRMSALADHLRRNGQLVTVVSAFEGLESLDQDDVRWEQLRRYQLIRIPIVRSRSLAFLVRMKSRLRRLRSTASPGSRSAEPGTLAKVGNPEVARSRSLRRLLFDILHVIDDKKRWSLHAMRKIMSAQEVPRTGVMIVSGPPMSTLLGAVLAARRLGIPIVVDLRDPICIQTAKGTPDHGFQAQWGRRALERYVLRRATFVTTTSPSLRKRLQITYPEVGDRISCIYNGFDEEPLPERSSTGNRLVVVYAGALYINRNPFPFLESVGHLLTQDDVDASRVEILFAGECDQYRGISLRRWLADRPWGDAVKIYPRLDSRDLMQLYERATLLLNFAEGQRTQVPAKTFELLALGRELLVLCEPDSDTAALVQGITGVSCAQSGDEVALRRLLLDVYQRHVVQGTLRAPLLREISQYSRAAQNERFVAVLDKIRRGVSDRR